METWSEKTTLKQCHMSSLLSEDFGTTHVCLGAKILQAEEPGNAKLLNWEEIWSWFRNKQTKKKQHDWSSEMAEWVEVRSGQGLIM